MPERLQKLPRGMQSYRAETTDSGMTVMRARIQTHRRGIDVHDTTLRDGLQKPGTHSTVTDKIAIAHAIDQIVRPDVIEAGWPGANPTDNDVFRILRDEEPLQHARLTSFGMTLAPWKHAGEDPLLEAQIEAKAPIKTIVGKADIFQVEQGLKKPREENLRMIKETMEYLKADADTEEVRFDAEHFFSGFRTDPEYALECIRAAAAGGADMVVLCDTMGDAMPEDVELAMQTVLGDEVLHAEYAKHHGEGMMPVGMHAHNDTGLAVAHTLSAIRLGATSIQGTINGLGERIGNANIQTVMLTRTRKYGTEDIDEEHLGQMRALSEFVAQRTGIDLSEDLPYVGDNAAKHKGGLHTRAVLEEPELYEHEDPVTFGNSRKIAVSGQNGTAGIKYNLEELSLPFEVSKRFAHGVTEEIKERSARGYDYEQAHASFDLLARKLHPDYDPNRAPFTIIEAEHDGVNTRQIVINTWEGDELVQTALEPIAVIESTELTFNALRDALGEYYPAVKDMDILTSRYRPHNGTSAEFITVSHEGKSFTTTGVADKNMKGLAIFEAVSDAFEYAIIHTNGTTEK